MNVKRTGAMWMSNNPYLTTNAGAAYMNFKNTDMLNRGAEKGNRNRHDGREYTSLSSLPDNGVDIICVPLSEKILELRLGGGATYFSRAWEQSGSYWKFHGACILKRDWMKKSWNEIRLLPGNDAYLGNLSVIQKLILPHHEESKKKV